MPPRAKNLEKTRTQPPRRAKQHLEEDASSDTATEDTIILDQSDESDEQVVVSKAPRKKSGRKKVTFAEDGNEADDENRTRQKPTQAPTPPVNVKVGLPSLWPQESAAWWNIGCAAIVFIFALSIQHFFHHMQSRQSEKFEVKVSSDLPPPSEKLLTRYKSIYGSYDITRPDELPKYVSIKDLRERLSRDTPFLQYYNSLGNHWTSWPEKLENDWDRRFTEDLYDSDISDDERDRNIVHSIMMSIKVDGVMNGQGAVQAFIEARNVLNNDKQLCLNALQKVQSIFENGSPGKSADLVKFRKTQNWIKRGKETTMPHVLELPSIADKMVEYYNEKCLPLPERSLKYACCVLHWYRQYEIIQLFEDGNGIVGRVWVTAMLEHKGLPPLQVGEHSRNPDGYYELWKKGGQFWEDHLIGIMENITEPQIQQDTPLEDNSKEDDDQLEDEEL